MELDWESAFCRKYIELWFSLQNRHLRDKGRITIIVGIGALTSGVETLLGRKIEKFDFPDYTPFVGNKLQSDTIEYVYYKYAKRLLKIEEIIELMKECENDLKMHLSDTTYLAKKFIKNRRYLKKWN